MYSKEEILSCIVTMAVPVDPVTACQAVEKALLVCEDQFLAARAMLRPIQPTTLPPEGPLEDSGASCVPVDIIVCSVLLGALVMLHIIRQAWYLWGGEGAFAFPFDRYVYITLLSKPYMSIIIP
jgi:hypothetical protein